MTKKEQLKNVMSYRDFIFSRVPECNAVRFTFISKPLQVVNNPGELHRGTSFNSGC